MLTEGDGGPIAIVVKAANVHDSLLLQDALDTAFPANPFGIFAVYDSIAYQGQSGWFEVAGTSTGVPQRASVIAIADQTGVADGLTALSTSRTVSPWRCSVTGGPTPIGPTAITTRGLLAGD